MRTSKKGIKYGWRPQLPDNRDHVYAAMEKLTLPASVDNSTKYQPCYDQGQLGSCTANAIAGEFEHLCRKQGILDQMPSRLFIYYNERLMEGTITQDAGAEIRDGIKSISNGHYGVCTEAMLPYNVALFTKKPSATCYTAAKKNVATAYKSVDNTNITLLKQALAAGLGVVFGFSVYESFEGDTVAKTGIVNMPAKGEQLLGGHAVVLVGYDDAAKRFKVRNSWGAKWGQAGYFTIPYEYVTNSKLANDFWVLEVVKEG